MDDILTQWNHVAEVYAISQEASETVDINKSIVKSRFLDLSGNRGLDAGCGYGVFTDYFKGVGAHAIGCDGSIVMLKIAKKRYPACTFDQVDLQKRLLYCDNQFDAVFCNQVLMDRSIWKNLAHTAMRLTHQICCFFFLLNL